MKVVGLFSGVGGIEKGFENAGFNTVWSNEINENATKTFKLNHNSDIIVGDISEIKSKDIPKSDVIVAGFPCQAFSIAGYRKGFEDERGNTFFQLARVIRDKKPRAIFIENVKNLVSHDNGKTYQTIQETLNEYGYMLKPMVLNATEYGNVPQNRERIYIVGFRYKTHYEKFNDLSPIPLTSEISDIIDYDEKVDEKYYYTKEKYAIYNDMVDEITKRDTLYQWRRVYVRENKSNVCPTLTANMGTGGHNVPLVLTKHGIRKLSPAECFKFQGYDDIILPEELAQCHLYKQAGNSVVVPVVERIAKNMFDALQ